MANLISIERLLFLDEFVVVYVVVDLSDEPLLRRQFQFQLGHFQPRGLVLLLLGTIGPVESPFLLSVHHEKDESEERDECQGDNDRDCHGHNMTRRY